MSHSDQINLRSEIGRLLEGGDSSSFREDPALCSLEDAEALVWGLNQLVSLEPKECLEVAHPIVALLQHVETDSEEVLSCLRSKALPALLALDANLLKMKEEEAQDLRMFVLKQLAYFSNEAALARIVEAVRAPYSPEGYMWSIILSAFTHEHPLHKRLFEQLSNPLPRDFIRVALLDAANGARISGSDFPHPFESSEGIEQLRTWLRDPNPDNFGYAHSATVALPFISEPFRSQLLQLAMDHPDRGVSVEAAWAAAKIGQERGVRLLSKYAMEINSARVAMEYLAELGREDAIPEEALEPDFQAKAEMVHWLSHPNEFGEPPDEIELYDTRELFWPPTNDRRQVWLFKYHYKANEQRETDDIGLGMVGSVTFALFGETTADLSPAQAYALHCAWELENNGDERAPEERTVEAGLRILAEYNSL